MTWRLAPLAALTILALNAAPVAAATGDVNGDDFITTADVRLALRYAGGLEAPGFARLAAADVAPDGIVGIADAVRIARIATRLDALPPAHPLSVVATLTVNGNTTRHLALAGGYLVSGRVRDRAGRAFEGSVGFEDADGVFWGPAPLDDLGDYSLALPAGTYQAVVLTRRTDYSPNGEETISEAAVAAGAPFTVAKETTGRDFTRPDIPATATVTFDFSGPSRPLQTEANIYLTDTGANAATFGRNTVETDVLFTTAPRPVPPGTYFVDTRSFYPLRSGFMEELRIAFDQTLSVPSVKSRTLAFPTVYELAGDFTGPMGPDAVDFYAEQVPKAGSNQTTAYVLQRFGGYLVEIPSGSYTASIAVNTPFEETMAEFLRPFTMPARQATLDISLPALPTFRTVTGTVLDPSGQPLAGARVQAEPVPTTVPTSGVYVFHGDTLTDEDGAYTLNLPNGTYTLTVSPS